MDKFTENRLFWINAPEIFTIANDKVTITTQPHTDLWQKTYYHFINDNAPLLLTTTDNDYFSFTVKTDFNDSHARFDQCGLIVYIDNNNWIKCSIEYENETYQHLGSVVTNHGYSDWATTEIDASTKSMWYRISRRQSDFRLENSYDGIHFKQMRICHLHQAQTTIHFGIYACSPESSSFTATFSDMTLSECLWDSHNGQKPDNIQE